MYISVYALLVISLNVSTPDPHPTLGSFAVFIFNPSSLDGLRVA